MVALQNPRDCSGQHLAWHRLICLLPLLLSRLLIWLLPLVPFDNSVVAPWLAPELLPSIPPKVVLL
jgi:hypothetical protein